MTSELSPAALEAVLDDVGIGGRVVRTTPLGGGCIHKVTELTLDDGRLIVVKANDASWRPIFEEELKGLLALIEGGPVLVPEPYSTREVDGVALLLMEGLPRAVSGATNETWSAFGRDLAAMHRARGESRYGFCIDNHLGATPQENTWAADWVEFNRLRRLGPQLERASAAGLLERGERDRVAAVIDRLDGILPDRPRPALLHGDLWSGNALVTTWRGAPRVAFIDPAPSFGDGWADIAMMRLFGGFPNACLAAYAAAVGEAEPRERVAVYQLYHLLNHVNLFGRGYVAQVMGVVDRL